MLLSIQKHCQATGERVWQEVSPNHRAIVFATVSHKWEIHEHDIKRSLQENQYPLLGQMLLSRDARKNLVRRFNDGSNPVYAPPTVYDFILEE